MILNEIFTVKDFYRKRIQTDAMIRRNVKPIVLNPTQIILIS